MIAAPVIESPAAQAGFEDQDEVISVAGKEVRTWQDFRIALIDSGIDGGTLPVKVRTVDLYETERQVEIGDLHILNEKEDVTKLLGFKLWRPQLPAVIGGTTPDSAAANAGLQEGDQVLAINQQLIDNWDRLVEVVQVNAGKSLEFSLLRDGVERLVYLTPAEKKRGDVMVGFMGAYPSVPEELINKTKTTIEYSVFEAFGRAANETWTFSVLTLKVLGKMLVGQAALENISGPITIAQYAGITASIGLLTYIKFLAMISVSLGVLNLLPVPMLDGGHLMYYLIEIVKGSPVSQKFEELGQQVGMTLLLMLMSLAIFNDIQRLIN